MATLKQRMHKKNSSGSYDTVHLETSSSLVLRPSGRTVEQDLADYLPKTQASDTPPSTLKSGLMVTGATTAWLGVNNEAKELFGSGSSGGGSMVPTWLITTTQTWTVPVTGNYRLICIGKGGDGGTGASVVYAVSSDQDTYYTYGYDSCGGAGGAVAIADKSLTINTILNCNITDIDTNINDTALKATAGGNGINATTGSIKYESDIPSLTYTAPTGGVASGSWMSYGYAGNTPEVNSTVHKLYPTRYGDNYLSYVSPVRQGGSSGCIITSPACNGTAGIGSFVSNKVDGTLGAAYGYKTTNISGSDVLTFNDVPSRCRSDILPGGGYAGAGGAGGAVCLYAYAYTSSSGYSLPRFTQVSNGGKGGIGAILIQFLGE